MLTLRPEQIERVTTRRGFSLFIHALPNDPISYCLRTIQDYEVYEADYVWRTLQPGMVAVDVGANIGFYSLLMAQRVGPQGRVIALEPEPRNMQLLRMNAIKMNAEGWAIEVLEAAAGQTHGWATLYLTAINTGGHCVYDAVGEVSDRISVPMVTLDEVLSTCPRVDFIKLDIQGAELDALIGATETLHRCKPTLLFELCPACLSGCQTSAEALLDWLAAQGYTLESIRGEPLGRDIIQQADAAMFVNIVGKPT